MTTMRAKLRVSGVTPYPAAGPTVSEHITFNGVAAKSYPADGSDEDNTYAKFSPSAVFNITIANPALLGKFAINDTFYVDFTPVPA